MSSQLTIKVEDQNGQTIVHFHGQIDEDADFSQVDLSSKNSIVFDLQNVTHLNSCGIREWIKFQEHSVQGKKVIYRNCPQVVVEQMNIVKGFVIENGIVESFYAPYYNEEADEEVKVLMRPEQVIDGKAPAVKSAEGVELEFDDIEAQYFSFIKNL